MTSAARRPRLVLVGAGHAANSIVRAVTAEQLAEVVAVVDPDPPPRAWVTTLAAQGKMVSSVAELPADGCFDVAAVAVPTPQHFDVLGQLLRAAGCPRLVLCEKPLTTSSQQAAVLAAQAAERGITLRMLLHFTGAGEVRWLVDNLGKLVERLGPLTCVDSHFRDDYCLTDLASARSRLGDPWLDSGVNSLSVVLQLLRLSRCVERIDEPCGASVRFEGTGGQDVVIRVAWDDPARRKVSTVSFRDGQVVVDHMHGTVTFEGTVLYHPAGEPYSARYGRLLAGHLGDGRRDADDRLEADVLTWLFAAMEAEVS